MTIENIEINNNKENNKIFYLSLYVYDKNKISQLANAILKYINQNPLLKTPIESRLKEVDTFIENAQKEIISLETLKNKIFSNINNDKISLLGINPVDIDMSLINLKAKVESLKFEKQVLQKGITSLSEPVIPKNKYKPKRSIIAAISFISSTFIAIFIVLLREWLDARKKIKE